MADQPTHSLEDELRRAEEAQYIVNHPLFKEAMATMKEEIVKTWDASPARDEKGREWLWMLRQAALKFEDHFQTVINTGKMARLQQKQSAVEKVANLFG